MEPDRHAIDQQLAAVALILSTRLVEVTQDVMASITGEIEQLRGDELVLALLHSSVEENVITCLHLFEHGTALDHVTVPTAAAEYARRLAQHDVSIIALIRAYRIGHGRFLQWCLDELARQCDDASLSAAVTRRMVELSFEYIDQTSEQVILTHQGERDHWLLTQTAMRAGRVRALLSENHPDLDVGTTESALGYRLRQYHVGLIAWVPEPTERGEGLARLERLAGEVARELACQSRPLFVPRDESSAWAWLSMGTRNNVQWELLRKAVDRGDPTVCVAAGEAGAGVEGFRQTHRQAVLAQSLALAAGGDTARVTTFAEIGPIALLCADLNATRAWVQTTLGALANDDEQFARLRETLQVFFATGGSYTATAERLILHKNTVQYRIHKAEELSGRPLQDNRADVELALRACHWLGSAVLQAARR